MTIIVEQTINDTDIEVNQEVIVTEITVSELGEIGHGVPAGGNDGDVLSKDGDVSFITKWIPNTVGTGGISDAPNNANAYVRSGLAWVIGYTKTAIDSLISSSLIGYATQSWVNSQGFITNVISALGFTPYNATNPSGYQDASQVTTAINSRINSDPYSSQWQSDQNGATKDVLFEQFEVLQGQLNNKQPLSAVLTATTASFTTADETKLDGIATGATANDTDANLKNRANHTGTQLANTISDFDSATDVRVAIGVSAKQNNLNSTNFGTFLNSLTAKNTLVDSDEVTSDDSTDTSKAKKTSWLNVWNNYLKPKADALFQPLATVLTNTTASFTTAQETKLAKYPSTATNGKILQGNGTNYVEVDMPSGGGATPQTGQIKVTSGTSFTTPANITTNTVFYIELVGGGGGGGALTTTNSSGSGGGGGGYCFIKITGLNPSTSYVCQIGQGGATATAGGNTILTVGEGFDITAQGGGAGVNAVSSNGGVGGEGVNGNINITGQAGEDSTTASGAVPSASGGSSPKGWGLGGSGVRNTLAGKAGTGYGAGGSAGKQNATGGSGTNGIIYAQWFN